MGAMQDALLDQYVAFLRAERNLAPRTVEAYALDLRDFLDRLPATAPRSGRQGGCWQ